MTDFAGYSLSELSKLPIERVDKLLKFCSPNELSKLPREVKEAMRIREHLSPVEQKLRFPVLDIAEAKSSLSRLSNLLKAPLPDCKIEAASVWPELRTAISSAVGFAEMLSFECKALCELESLAIPSLEKNAVGLALTEIQRISEGLDALEFWRHTASLATSDSQSKKLSVRDATLRLKHAGVKRDEKTVRRWSKEGKLPRLHGESRHQFFYEDEFNRCLDKLCREGQGTKQGTSNGHFNKQRTFE